MGLQLMVLAKLNLITTTHSLSPIVLTGLVWPFVLKLSFSFRPIHQVYEDFAYALRLFIFRLGHITFNTGPGLGDDRRWERALRLVYESVAQARRSQNSESEEDSLRDLSMLAL